MDTISHASVTNIPMTQMDQVKSPPSLVLQGNEQHRKWFNALVDDDASFVDDVLKVKAPHELQLYLNGPFEYGDRSVMRDVRGKLFGRSSLIGLMRAPIMVAVRYGSRNVLTAILALGADIDLCDECGCNVFHSMVMLCPVHNDIEGDMVDMFSYVTRTIGHDMCKKLLLAENNRGLRPLELAADQGLFKLVKAILHTPRVYLIAEQNLGVITYQMFDITEYENSCCTGSRNGKSPLAYLTYMDKDTSAKPDSKELLEWLPFKQWQRYKVRANVPWLVLWFLQRLLTTMFIVTLLMEYSPGQDGNASNVTDGTITYQPQTMCNQSQTYIQALFSPSRNYIGLLMLILCGVGILVDLVELLSLVACRKRKAIHTAKYGKTVVLVLFPRIVQFLFLTTVIMICLRYTYPSLEHMMMPFNIVRLAFCIVSSCTCITFLYGVPILGHYVNILLRMLVDLLFVVLMYIILMLPFAAFYKMFFASNSKQGCVADYRDLMSSMYSLYFVSFFARDFRKYEVTDRGIMFFTHILFTIIVGILLINFLIAVMSDSATSISGQSEMIVRLERLHQAFTIENRLHWILGAYYNNSRKKYLTVENNRVYLSNCVINNNTRQPRAMSTSI